jgi:hypothetical protein
MCQAVQALQLFMRQVIAPVKEIVIFVIMFFIINILESLDDEQQKRAGYVFDFAVNAFVRRAHAYKPIKLFDESAAFSKRFFKLHVLAEKVMRIGYLFQIRDIFCKAAVVDMNGRDDRRPVVSRDFMRFVVIDYIDVPLLKVAEQI